MKVEKYYCDICGNEIERVNKINCIELRLTTKWKRIKFETCGQCQHDIRKTLKRRIQETRTQVKEQLNTENIELLYEETDA